MWEREGEERGAFRTSFLLFNHCLCIIQLSVLASTWSPGLPSRTILDRTYSAQRFFSFLVIFIIIFLFWVVKAVLTAGFRAHVNIVSLSK